MQTTGIIPHLYFRNGLWELSVSHGEELIVLTVKHHFGYDDLIQYREKAFKAVVNTEEGTCDIVTRAEFDERYQAIAHNEGRSVAIDWEETYDGFIEHPEYKEVVERLKDWWMSVVFTMQLFKPQICL